MLSDHALNGMRRVRIQGWEWLTDLMRTRPKMLRRERPAPLLPRNPYPCAGPNEGPSRLRGGLIGWNRRDSCLTFHSWLPGSPWDPVLELWLGYVDPPALLKVRRPPRRNGLQRSQICLDPRAPGVGWRICTPERGAHWPIKKNNAADCHYWSPLGNAPWKEMQR